MTQDREIPKTFTNAHKGWNIWYYGEHPVTGRWRAVRFGVTMGAGTFDQLIRMIDVRVTEERTGR